MIHQLQPCKKADILDADGQPLYTAAVRTTASEILLSLPYDCDLPSQDRYLLVFYHPVRGLITCSSILRLARRAQNEASQHIYSAEILERLSQNQRRSDLKTAFEHRVHIRSFGGSEYAAETVNLSAGGVCFRSIMRAIEGDKIFFPLNNGQVNTLLVAEILRVIPFDATSHPPIFEYGCRFLELSPPDEEMIRSLVFQLDRQQAKTMS